MIDDIEAVLVKVNQNLKDIKGRDPLLSLIELKEASDSLKSYAFIDRVHELIVRIDVVINEIEKQRIVN